MSDFLTNKNVPETGFTEAELAFIQKHSDEDVTRLILKSGQFKDLDVKKLAAQILSRQKASKKLPEWASIEKLIFPPSLSVEQSSSEATAKYKSSLIKGKTLIDITGGMGVDSFYLSKNFEKTHYFEQQEEVAKTAEYNFGLLSARNIEVHNADSIEGIEKNNMQANWIYADPARRDANKQKVVLLSDCAPDVKFHLPELFKHAPNILLKTSPLLDIDLAVQELKLVREVHVIGYEQECKELLFNINETYNDEFLIKARVINTAGETIHELDFSRNQERDAVIEFSEPISYLYEPHPAILKAGAFKYLCTAFEVKKLAAHSHLYTSKNLVSDFPGRTFEVTAVCKPDAKGIGQFVPDNKANLTIRNFPAKIDDLRKKWRLKEGGDIYLFATTLFNQKRAVVVTKKL
ncbi:THUMP-like domain-containing protein [Dyadobacter frigoris]|uniref:Uncharacterized protein n=1 Tax=Dyadobacter frigoris TaxID=2576211 RepID=A0A4U6D2T5_9BACT|nr:class I SAM-dependent methyltransferase [Dyadobacter frigoris]TKT91570.1 hypothetical protein FDK13_14475 [Dyadobacter frigoris]GLU51871.1 hypothetical protein Dfri01_13320 [Dyadobacter frigoris]